MPLHPSFVPVNQGNSTEDPLYFDSLDELDAYLASPRKAPKKGMSFVPRSDACESATQNRGKLIVCHDYKGGYTEQWHALGYTFNFWSTIESFIYFSHRRVTLPPPAWTTAAHRHGVKMLGTLIFEHEASIADNIRILVGLIPTLNTSTHPSRQSPLPSKFSVSPYYAKVLARLAKERNFDGYLLNFEYPLPGGAEQARILAMWVSLLRHELKQQVGEWAEVVWYDSIVHTGALRWQDRLDSHNLPFYLAATSIFTNYTWHPVFPSLSAQYLLSVSSDYLQDSSKKALSSRLSSIYTGIDVWGRGSHGGGGFGVYKALEHIDPGSMGMSAAIFGMAWTWESDEAAGNLGWSEWWQIETALWVGPQIPAVLPPPKPQMPGHLPIPECSHGPYKPVCEFFSHLPPPNPSSLRFMTHFSPGVGKSWWVCGTLVSPAASLREPGLSRQGWTDIDKQCSLGDMLWPKPTPTWLDESTGAEGAVNARLHFDDAWLGGSSVLLEIAGSQISTPDDGDSEEVFRCVSVPIQSLALKPHQRYQARLVYKILDLPSGGQHSEADVSLTFKLLHSVSVSSGMLDSDDVQIHDIYPMQSDLLPTMHTGWQQVEVAFSVPADYEGDFFGSLNVQIAFTSHSNLSNTVPTPAVSLLLGLLSVTPVHNIHTVAIQPRVAFVEYDQASSLLQWETCFTHSEPVVAKELRADDPTPIWALTPNTAYDRVIYYNLYALPTDSAGQFGDVEEAVWIGTTTFDGGNEMDLKGLPSIQVDNTGRRVRFYVQGVTELGVVMESLRCGHVDVDA